MFLHDWKDSGIEGMKSDFGINDAALEGVTVLLASYTYEDYSGDAFVLFERGGKLYEVNGSHCSCYGLSESSYSGDTTTQWQPEETTVEALRHRLEKGSAGEVADELRKALDALPSNDAIQGPRSGPAGMEG
jgi:hypothetical protein